MVSVRPKCLFGGSSRACSTVNSRMRTIYIQRSWLCYLGFVKFNFLLATFNRLLWRRIPLNLVFLDPLLKYWVPAIIPYTSTLIKLCLWKGTINCSFLNIISLLFYLASGFVFNESEAEAGCDWYLELILPNCRSICIQNLLSTLLLASKMQPPPTILSFLLRQLFCFHLFVSYKNYFIWTKNIWKNYNKVYNFWGSLKL